MMLLLYGPLGSLLLNVNSMPVPWETMVLSVSVYVALPLVALCKKTSYIFDQNQTKSELN